jgi:hypothetical protein
MLPKLFAGLALASLAAGAIIPRADSFPCGCPILGPDGTCLLIKNPFLLADQPGSVFCGTKGFNYVCNGNFNSQNCVRLAKYMQGKIILTCLERLRVYALVATYELTDLVNAYRPLYVDNLAPATIWTGSRIRLSNRPTFDLTTPKDKR